MQKQKTPVLCSVQSEKLSDTESETDSIADDSRTLENADGNQNDKQLKTDDELCCWLHDRRQKQEPWSHIADTLAKLGRVFTENALRKRYQRWCEKQDINSQE